MNCRAAACALTALALFVRLAAAGVVELHAAAFHALVTSDEDRDALVFFYDGAGACAAAPDCAAALAVADDVAARVGPSVAIALYDVAAHGVPAGVHVHGSPAVLLIAAGDRGSFEYAWWRDAANDAGDGGAEGGARDGAGASVDHVDGDSHGGDGHDHGHDDDHDHGGATCGHAGHGHAHGDGGRRAPHRVLRAAALLAWLRDRTTFPSDVPAPTLADTWRGREAGVVRAVADGLEALRQIVAELRAENAQLRRALLAAGGARGDAQGRRAARGGDEL